MLTREDPMAPTHFSMKRNNQYHNYQEFKGWTEAPDSSHDPLFAEEIASLCLKKGARVVEVGFGEGRFLDFARRSGFDVIGLEIIPDLVRLTADRGHSTFIGKLSDLFDQAASFDLVLAFDVVEHLTTDELTVFLSDAAVLLRDGGFILLRFPNGNSPFSLWFMNSDVTHQSYLTDNSLMQLAGPLGFRLERVSNAKLIPPIGTIKHVRRRISYWVRSIMETLIGLSYFGKRVPLDSNLVVVLAK